MVEVMTDDLKVAGTFSRQHVAGNMDKQAAAVALQSSSCFCLAVVANEIDT